VKNRFAQNQLYTKPRGTWNGGLFPAGQDSILPIKFLLYAWGLIGVNFLLGSASYAFPSVGMVVYIFAAVAVIIGTYRLAFIVTNPLGISIVPTMQRGLRFWRYPLLLGSLLSCIAAIVSFNMLSQSGRTLRDSIELTGLVRNTQAAEMGIGATIANAVGFASQSCLFMTFIFLRNGGGLKRITNKLSLLFSAVGVAFLLLSYVSNANRTAFLYLILMLLFYVVVFERGRYRDTFKKVGKYGVIAACGLVVLTVGYFLFIAINRTGEKNENSLFVSEFIKLRYRLPETIVPGELAEGIYKLQWYGSHQIDNLNLFFRGGHLEWVKVEPSAVFFWLYQQLGRLWPDFADIAKLAETNGTLLAEMSGGHSWQWYTGFAPFLVGFGIVGSLIVLSAFGALLGWLHATFLRDGSMLSVILLLWLLALCLMLMVYFPNDNYFHSNVFYLVVAKFLAIFAQRRFL